MRNFIKPAGSPARRRARGVAAVIASVALAAGLGSYPAVQAEETTTVSDITTDDAGLPTYSWMEDGEPSASATPSAPASESASKPTSASASKPAEAPATANPVTVERKGDVDSIVVNDPEGEAWEFGGKASKENIFALQREGKGEIKEVLSVTADGRKLEPYDYGFVNSADGGFVAFNLNALHTIPPMVVEIEARTTDAGEYAIADSNVVPSEAQLAESGYGKDRPAEEAPDDQLRAGSATEITGHPGQMDQSLSFQKVSETYRNGKKELKLKLDEPGKWKLTQFRIWFPGGTGGPSLGSKPEIWVGNNKLGYDQLPVYNSKKSGSGIFYDRTYLTLDSGQAADGPNWNYQGPEIVIDSDDVITFIVDGPAQPDYSVEIRGQERPDKIIRFFGHDGVQLTDPNFNEEGTHFEASTTVESRIKFKEAIVKIKAPSSRFDWKYFHFDASLIEPGVKFKVEKLPGNNDGDNVEFQIVPVKDGKVVDSVLVEKGSNFSISGNYFNNPTTIDGTVDIFGESVIANPPPANGPVPPYRGDLSVLPKIVPNPVMPKKCGLKVAIVADRSTSLSFADKNGHQETMRAGLAFLDALKGTATQLGVYEFATNSKGPGTTGGAVRLDTVEGQQQAEGAIKRWGTTPSTGATNWEAGLKQVRGQGYDIVYFITDGMPTIDDGGWQPTKPAEVMRENGSGAFLQETSLRRAILEANQLKQEGTRIVPIMVDVTLKNEQKVTEEYVLRDILRTADYGRNQLLYWELVGNVKERSEFGYQNDPNKNDPELPNFKALWDNGYAKILKSGRPDGFNQKKDMSRWTLGTVGYYETGEFISGKESPVSIDKYSDLAANIKSIAEDMKQYCEGELIVQKQTYNEKGELVDVVDAPKWKFTASDAAGKAVLKNGYRIPTNKDLGNPNGAVSSSSQQIAGETVEAPNKTVKGEAAWRIISNSKTSLKVEEQSEPGYKLKPQDGKNAVCTQTLGFKDSNEDNPNPGYFESVAEVVNDGDNGFTVKAEPYASVRCIVVNQKQKPDTGLDLQLEKVDADGKTGSLSGAEFNLSWKEDGQVKNHQLTGGTSKYSVENVMRPGVEYTLTETKAPQSNGVQYALLVQPLKFKIESASSGGYQVKYYDGVNYSESLPAEIPEGKVVDGDPRPVIALKVANVRQGNLPKTGGAGLLMPTAAGLLTIALGAVMGVRRQRS